MKRLRNKKPSIKPEKTRTIFLSLELPEWLRERLGEVQEEISISGVQKFPDGSRIGAGRSSEINILWELPEKLHITLEYMGRITKSEYGIMLKVLKEKANDMNGFEINVGYLDYLYQRHGNGLIWARADGGNELIEWHRGLVKELNKNGFSVSEKKLVPHITIGRLKRMRNDDQKRVLQAATEKELPNLGTFMAEEVVVMSSKFRKDWKTTEYEVVERVSLKITNNKLQNSNKL